MKRYICLIISLCLVLGSFSFCFAAVADWTTTDQQNLSNAASRLYYNGYSAGYYLKQIADSVSNISTISSDISTIKGYLFEDGHSIGYWVNAISTWMSPIYSSISSLPSNLLTIEGGLGAFDGNGGYSPFLVYNGKSAAQYLSEFADLKPALTNAYYGNFSNSVRRYNAHTLFVSATGAYNIPSINGQFIREDINTNWTDGSPLGNVAALLRYVNLNLVNSYRASWMGFNNTQNAVNWASLQTSTFTPTSYSNGVYSWLSAIQAPVARLSYVMASDERIAAQEAAAPAEQQVIDDFIDPTGDSSATASDFGSISDLSSGYQQNFGSTASVTGIFDIFDSTNFGWFSTETYNQLDTTVATRGSSFETPLLDQQLEDISRALGVDYAN